MDQSLSHYTDVIANELELATHGFNVGIDPLDTIGLNLQGPPVILSNDTVVGVSEKDVKSYKSYLEDLKRFAKMLKPFWHKKMPRIGKNSISDVITFGHLGLNLRMLGKKDMGEFMRVATLPTRDLPRAVRLLRRLPRCLCLLALSLSQESSDEASPSALPAGARRHRFSDLL